MQFALKLHILLQPFDVPEAKIPADSPAVVERRAWENPQIDQVS